MQLVLVIAAIICFLVAWINADIKGLRFEWMAFALLTAAWFLA